MNSFVFSWCSIFSRNAIIDQKIEKLEASILRLSKMTEKVVTHIKKISSLMFLNNYIVGVGWTGEDARGKCTTREKGKIVCFFLTALYEIFFSSTHFLPRFIATSGKVIGYNYITNDE
jgi:hypothetical protein